MICIASHRLSMEVCAIFRNLSRGCLWGRHFGRQPDLSPVYSRFTEPPKGDSPPRVAAPRRTWRRLPFRTAQ